MHIIISYTENQITFVYLQKPTVKRSAPEKIARMDPKIFNIIVGGPQERKLPRYLSCNNSYDLLVIWTKSSQNEVFPWRPTVRDQDRANIHVFKFSRTKLELITYHWTEYDPICIEFSKLNHNQFKSVEQKCSKKGDVTIENCTYEINDGVIQRMAVTAIPLQTQVMNFHFERIIKVILKFFSFSPGVLPRIESGLREINAGLYRWLGVAVRREP